MIRVLDILENKLPVTPHALSLVAEDPERSAIEVPVKPAKHLGAEIVLKRGHVMVKTREDDAMTGNHFKTLQPMVLLVKVFRHPAKPLNPVTKGDRGGLARQLISPLVIRTDERLQPFSIGVIADLSAAMSTAIYENVDLAVCVAGEYDRLIADLGCSIVAGLRNLAF
jgi:hypothetical protein